MFRRWPVAACNSKVAKVKHDPTSNQIVPDEIDSDRGKIRVSDGPVEDDTVIDRPQGQGVFQQTRSLEQIGISGEGLKTGVGLSISDTGPGAIGLGRDEAPIDGTRKDCAPRCRCKLGTCTETRVGWGG